MKAKISSQRLYKIGTRMLSIPLKKASRNQRFRDIKTSVGAGYA
jgi:hypothetical protein